MVILMSTLMLCCDVDIENERIGTLEGSSGRIHVLYLGCAEERVERLELVDVEGTVGGGDDAVVWRVAATPPVREVDVIVGEEGNNFEVIVPLTRSLRGTLTLIVATEGGGETLLGVDFDA